MISIKDLTVSYPGHERVIDSLNVTFEEGLIHGIVGLNGSGKTTLLNAIFGLLKIQSGIVLYHDNRLTKKESAYLTSENYFYSNITGAEYIGLFKNPSFETQKWFELLSLPPDEIIDNYSAGMKKKLALLGVLKQDKHLMILDEPFNSLDIETCRIVRSVLLRLKEKGKTVIITSHIIETLTNLCDCIHFLENGKIKYSREKNEFADFEKEIFESLEMKNLGTIQDLIP
jgi:ABC-2 type transport system ATP-binding protein